MTVRYICKQDRIRCILEGDEYHRGQFYDINAGHIITLHRSGAFISEDGRFLSIPPETIEKYFERYYTEEETKEWFVLRNQAAITFCDTFLRNADPADGADAAVEKAIAVANHLIEKLKRV